MIDFWFSVVIICALLWPYAPLIISSYTALMSWLWRRKVIKKLDRILRDVGDGEKVDPTRLGESRIIIVVLIPSAPLEANVEPKEVSESGEIAIDIHVRIHMRKCA